MYGNDPTQRGGAMVGTAAPAKKRSLTWLWITLGTIAAVLVVGGAAGAFALIQYTAPAAAAGQFCGYLKTQNYDSAYGMLSGKLKGAFSSEQFRTGNAALDVAEGKVTMCGAASGSGSYDYSLGGSKATVKAKITRETQGDLTGNLQLVNESGWKVDAMDTALLGINLSALQTLGAFCTALQAQDYTTAYGFLSSSLQSLAPQATFTLAMQAHDQIDGNVTACTLSSIPPGNTDTSTMVTAKITRSKLGAKSGPIALDGTGGTWKITKIDDSVQGTDLGPLATGLAFCLALQASDYKAAYTLFSAAFKAHVTEAAFAAAFTSTLPAGAKWGTCKPDYTTYKVTGTTAQYSGTIDLTFQGITAPTPITLNFILEGGVWKIESFS